MLSRRRQLSVFLPIPEWVKAHWPEWTVLLPFALLLAGGVWLGFLTLAIVIAAGLVVVVLCLQDSRPWQYLAITALLLVPFLMVAAPLRPDEYNYYSYAIGLMGVVGCLVAVKNRHRIQPMGAFLAWLLASAVVTTLRVGVDPVYAIAIAPLGLLGAYLMLTHSEPGVSRLFLNGFLILMAIEAVIGISQTMFHYPTFAVLDDITHIESRNYLSYFAPSLSAKVQMATGTFDHFNRLGALLCIAVPLAYARWQDNRSVLTGAYLALVSVGLVCTFSRGALLGAIIGVVILYVARPTEHTRRTARTFLLVLAALILGFLVYSQISEYFGATGNLASRTKAWVLALTYYVQDPFRVLFGAGYGFFRHSYLLQQDAIPSIHSALVQVLTETGLVGFGLLAWAITKTLIRSLGSQRPASSALGPVLLAFLVHQLFDNALFEYQGLLFMGLFALASRESFTISPNVRRRRRRHVEFRHD